MAFGPGKYDDLCTHAREATGAVGVILIVMGGAQGSGFSVQAPPSVTVILAGLLRDMADQIEGDITK